MNLYGEIPNSAVVFAACDSKYFLEHAGPFVYSADERGFDVHIHVVNPTDEVLSYAAILASTVQVRLTYTFHEIDVSQLQKEQQRAYYAALRFVIAPQLLEYAKKILILDIDCLIMNHFEFPKKPVGYYPREPLPGTVGWEAEGTKVAAGAVYFDIDAEIVCDSVSQTIRNLEMRWFNDQIALNHVISQVPEEFVHKFDSNFMDWEFKEGTTIWTGKGPRKYDNPTYVAEKHKYDRASDFMDYAKNVILTPRLDIMFKKHGLAFSNSVKEPIRQHWANFVSKLSSELKDVLIITAPRWFFNETIANKHFPKATVYVPHVEKSWWGGGDNCRYYMQTVFPWLFTIDEQGWAGGSKYKESFKNYIGDDDTAFNKLNQYVKEGGTKFEHLQEKGIWEKTKKYILGDEPYVLVPLQIPHDETIIHHSEINPLEFVEKICQWSEKSGMAVVFKGHPINIMSMNPMVDIISKYNSEKIKYITEPHIKDMISDACAVYVINSGTGQEAMLQEKPVVVFGRCDYEGAVIKGDLDDLAGTWERVKADDFEERKATYRRWFDWFVESITYDTRI